MLTKNADLDKYKYNSNSIQFDSRSIFLFTDGSFGENVMLFGGDMSSSFKRFYNMKKKIGLKGIVDFFLLILILLIVIF